MDASYDVVIVGYRPVGQVLAILLGERCWKVGVFEKQPAAYPLPRAVHFDHEVARILQATGLGGELPRLSEPADVYEWKSAAGETLLRIGSRGAGLSGWPGRACAPASATPPTWRGSSTSCSPARQGSRCSTPTHPSGSPRSGR